MKIIVNKIVSPTAVFLMLFSAFSVTVDSHYWSGFLIMVSYIDKPKVCKNDNKVDFYLKIKDYCTYEIQSIKEQSIEHKYELHAYVSNELAITKEKCSVTDFIFHSILLGDEFSQENTYQKKSLETNKCDTSLFFFNFNLITTRQNFLFRKYFKSS